jgi:hypothetical protein
MTSSAPRSGPSIRKYAKFAALGAIGVGFGVVALYGLLAFASSPSPTGGIDRTHATLAWISAAIPALCIIAAHLAYAKILFDESKRDG